MLYKDKEYFKKTMLFYQICFLFFDVFALFMNVRVILFFLESWTLVRTAVVLVRVMPLVLSIYFLFVCGLAFVDVGIILMNRYYFFRTAVEIKLYEKGLVIQCVRKTYYIDNREEIQIKDRGFHRIFVLKVPAGKKFYIWRYRVDGSGEELVDRRYFRMLFPKAFI